jgi:TRAP-type uncharacterized transport system fused permease subunit
LATIPKGGSWIDVVQVTLETLAGIAILAFAFQGRLLRKSSVVETVLFTLGGMLLVFPELIAAILNLVGIKLILPHLFAFALAGIAVLMQWMRPAAAEQVTRL